VMLPGEVQLIQDLGFTIITVNEVFSPERTWCLGVGAQFPLFFYVSFSGGQAACPIQDPFLHAPLRQGPVQQSPLGKLEPGSPSKGGFDREQFRQLQPEVCLDYFSIVAFPPPLPMPFPEC